MSQGRQVVIVRSFKPEPVIRSGGPLPDTHLIFDQTIPDFPSLRAMRAAYWVEALKIARTLRGAMPQGLYDAVVAAMLKQSASLLIHSVDGLAARDGVQLEDEPLVEGGL